MGQKVNPIGIRLGITRDWTSKWYAGSKTFASNIHTDFLVRKFLAKKLSDASVSRIHIERAARRANITIHTARPGIVIGKKGEDSVCSMHQSNSSAFIPFHAKTATPLAAMAAAAWSCVEKMLHELQRTSAPSAVSVSISTAVWIVMWRQPAIFAPFKGNLPLYSSRNAIRPGISYSAMVISLRPKSACEMSLTL